MARTIVCARINLFLNSTSAGKCACLATLFGLVLSFTVEWGAATQAQSPNTSGVAGDESAPKSTDSGEHSHR